MKRRSYRMRRRAETAEQTRRRIVRACFELHARQGISGTTMSEIAGRAGVGVGTVYHHFPTYEDAITACGQYTIAMAPPPDESVLAGCSTLAQRLKALAAAIFGHFERLRFFARVRADGDRYAAVQAFVEQEAATRLALTRAALAPFGLAERDVQVAAALLDVAVHDGLCQAGFSTQEAAREIAGTLHARLTRKPSTRSRRSR